MNLLLLLCLTGMLPVLSLAQNATTAKATTAKATTAKATTAKATTAKATITTSTTAKSTTTKATITIKTTTTLPTKAAAVNGNWGDWADASTCTKSQTRQCNNPTAANGGIACQGCSAQTVACGANHCPGYSLEKTSTGNFTVSCGSGFLSFCGTKNSQFLNQDFYRYSVPADSQTCNCYDSFGITCRAFCTASAIQGFQIVSKEIPMSVKQDYVTCPAGKQVIGCNAIPSRTDYEKYPMFYPTSDGTQCYCYNFFGTTCVATCASGLTGYEVVSASDVGLVKLFKVTCPLGKYVRGCGFKTNAQVGEEKYRVVYVEDDTSCVCYDHFGGTTCYAICTY